MRHDKTLGGPVATFRKPGLAVMAFLWMLVFDINIVAKFKPGKGVNDAFFVTFIMAIGTYALWLLASSAVRINREGLMVDNFLMRHIIPWQQLGDIGVGDGLMIRLRDGTRIRSVMYCGSLLRELGSGYRLTEQACARMNAKRKEILSNGVPDEGHGPYRRIINFSPWPPLVILAVLEALTSLSVFR